MDYLAVSHQRPMVVDKPCIEPRDESAVNYLQQQKRQGPSRNISQSMSGPPFRVHQVQCDPKSIGKGDERRNQVQCKPVVAHVWVVDQPAFYHVPAKESLQRTKSQKDKALPDGMV